MVKKHSRFLFSIIFQFVLLCSCVEQIELPSGSPEDDGLEAVSLRIGRDNLMELMKATFTDRWFPLIVNKDGTELNGRIRTHGGLARHYPKKTFKVKVYEGYPEEVANVFQLSSQYSDDSYCRYRLGREFFKRAGFLCSEVSPVHLYFDKQYHGIYLRIEIVDELFFRRRNLPISSLYKVRLRARLTSKYGMPPQSGFDKKLPEDDMSYKDLERLFIILDRGVSVADTAELSSVLDIENALSYYAVAVLLGHGDGINHNYYLYYNTDICKFQFIPWDLDLIFYRSPSLTPNYANNLFEQLIAIDAYNSYVKNRMKGIFDYEELDSILDCFAEEVRIAVSNDPWLVVENRNFEGEVADLHWYLARINSLLSTIK